MKKLMIVLFVSLIGFAVQAQEKKIKMQNIPLKLKATARCVKTNRKSSFFSCRCKIGQLGYWR